MIATIDSLPVYNAVLSDEDCGMFRISLVDDPAVMSLFQAFSATARKSLMYSIQNEEKRLVRGVVMRADFPIFRSDDAGEYYVIYRAEQIRKMAEKYLAESRQNDVNLMHGENTDVKGVQMVQYFIKDTEAGVNPVGFEDISDGSLFAEFHIHNDMVWEEIKAGTFKGFSLEGVFSLVPERNEAKVDDIVDSLDGLFSKLFKHYKNMTKLEKFKAALAKMLQEFGNITTDRGILAWDGEEDLKAGDAIYVEDAEGNRVPAEDGEYATEDGKVIVVAEGKVSEIKDAEAEVAPESPAPEEPVVEEEAKKKACKKFGKVATDIAELIWEGEEDLKAGIAVFVEREGELVPAEDGDYKTEDGKVIKVAEGVVAEIADPEAEVDPAPESSEAVEALRKENEALKAEVARLQKMSAAKPAHEEVEASVTFKETGNKGLDNLARILNAR